MHSAASFCYNQIVMPWTWTPWPLNCKWPQSTLICLCPLLRVPFKGLMGTTVSTSYNPVKVMEISPTDGTTHHKWIRKGADPTVGAVHKKEGSMFWAGAPATNCTKAAYSNTAQSLPDTSLRCLWIWAEARYVWAYTTYQWRVSNSVLMCTA